MRNVAFAVAATALLGAGPALSQPNGPTAESPRPQAAVVAKPRVKMAVSHPTPAPAPDPSIESQNQLVAQYCAGCHSERLKSGELVLTGFEVAKAEQNADTAEKMIRKLRAGT